jgi:hypothetical protein
MKFYKEAESDVLGFLKTLPHWRWVNGFLNLACPSMVEEARRINGHGMKVAGGVMNGLAITFRPAMGHRDALGKGREKECYSPCR